MYVQSFDKLEMGRLLRSRIIGVPSALPRKAGDEPDNDGLSTLNKK